MYYRHDERMMKMNMALVLVLVPILFVVTFGISALGWGSLDSFMRGFMGYTTLIFGGVWLAVLEGETKDFRSRVKAMIWS